MKIKGLIILSALCIGIMILVLIFAKQNIETTPLSVNAPVEQALDYPRPLSSAVTNINTETMPMPQGKSAITIISKPSSELKDEIVLPTIDSYENIPSIPTAEENTGQAGITVADKYPTKKEAQELQSKGIVLY